MRTVPSGGNARLRPTLPPGGRIRAHPSPLVLGPMAHQWRPGAAFRAPLDQWGWFGREEGPTPSAAYPAIFVKSATDSPAEDWRERFYARFPEAGWEVRTFHDRSDSKGIGLYVVYNHIVSLGGRIEVESQLGRGSTFTFTVPIASEQGEE